MLNAGAENILARFRRLPAGDRGLIAAPWTPLASLCAGPEDPNRGSEPAEFTRAIPPQAKVPFGFIEEVNNNICVLQRRAYGGRGAEQFRLKILTCIVPNSENYPHDSAKSRYSFRQKPVSKPL